MIKETNLVTMATGDFTSTDNVRVLDGGTSRKITLQDFSASQVSIFEGLGFLTGASIPADLSALRDVATKMTTYVVTIADSVILANSAGGSYTVTLPTAASAWSASNTTGQIFTIKRITTDVNSVTVAAPGAELIDGSATVILAGPALTFVTVISDGSNWWQIA